VGVQGVEVEMQRAWREGEKGDAEARRLVIEGAEGRKGGGRMP